MIICPFTELFIHLSDNLLTNIFFPLTELFFSVMSSINNIIQQAMWTKNKLLFCKIYLWNVTFLFKFELNFIFIKPTFLEKLYMLFMIL